jgi:putative photosynthetic complex assembly protein 2
MMTFAAIAFVVVLWGLSTALIFYLDSLPTSTFPLSMAASTLVLIFCLLGIWLLADGQSEHVAAASFAAGLLAWGWTEMSLYMGYVTGPRKHRCAEGCSGLRHFGHALAANLWHELAVISLAAGIWLSANETALLCFTMLWLMHLSARLNVFLGVRNISAEFVPPHMDVLKGFMRRRPMNWLFPFSCLALLTLLVHILSLPHSFTTTMAATLAAIGLLEHILLMLPLPIERLWYWSLSPVARQRERHDHKDTQSQPPSSPRTTIGAMP